MLAGVPWITGAMWSTTVTVNEVGTACFLRVRGVARHGGFPIANVLFGAGEHTAVSDEPSTKSATVGIV